MRAAVAFAAVVNAAKAFNKIEERCSKNAFSSLFLEQPHTSTSPFHCFPRSDACNAHERFQDHYDTSIDNSNDHKPQRLRIWWFVILGPERKATSVSQAST